MDAGRWDRSRSYGMLDDHFPCLRCHQACDLYSVLHPFFFLASIALELKLLPFSVGSTETRPL